MQLPKGKAIELEDYFSSHSGEYACDACHNDRTVKHPCEGMWSQKSRTGAGKNPLGNHLLGCSR